MTISALFLSVMVTTSTLVLAEDCTMTELTTISSIYSSAVGDSCPDMTTTTDYCSYEDCVNFMSDMLEELPNCSTGGVNVNERVQAVVGFCDTGNAVTSATSTDSSSSSATTMTSSSGSALPTVGTTSSDQVTGNTAPSTTGGSFSSSSTSLYGFAISSAAFAVTAFFAGL